MLSGKDVLLTEERGRIFVMTLNRPERCNAFSHELSDRLAQEWEYFNENDELWAAILTGVGDVAFCAGHDLKEDVDGDVRGGQLWSHQPYPARRPSSEVPTWKPTIAAINGYCMAGGWRFAQECDVRLAADHATFGIPEVKWNLPASFGAHWEYQASFGIAAEMLMWGRPINAQRAYEIGFVNKIVPASELMQEAMAWAEHVCTLGQESVRAHKQLLHRARNMSAQEIRRLGRELFYWYPPQPGVELHAKEGLRAFNEKRPPEYREPAGTSEV